MTRKAGAALFFVLAALFLIANRGAYEGYFQDDELDNINWTTETPLSAFAAALVTPRFIPGNFRPAGHLYFRVAGRNFGLDFPKYVFPIHALHLLNVWLLWLVARRLGGDLFGAGAAALFFAFHMGAFDALWKPMYVFDLLCTTFCLASLLFWMRRRWVLSFVAFWLAYKSKELAVMLPAVLAAYEYWLGKREWKPLIPFFAVSLSFGLQGILLSRHHEDEYTFHFTPAALGETIRFYSGRLAMFPFGGLAVLVLPFAVRDRRVWFAVASMALFFVPLLFLPGRTFGAYTYLPIAALALAMPGLRNRAAVAGFFLLWIPWNYVNLRWERRKALTIAADNRAYVTQLREAAAANPGVSAFVYDGRPEAMHQWGIAGVLGTMFHRTEVPVLAIDDPEGKAALRQPAVMILQWDAAHRKLNAVARRPGVPEATYIVMNGTTPVWQLTSGWYALEGWFRWTEPVATARLRVPAGTRQFEVEALVSPDMLREMRSRELRVSMAGKLLGTRVFTQSGRQAVRWEVPAGLPSPVEVRFEAQPPYRPSNNDPRALGIAITAFGFLVPEHM